MLERLLAARLGDLRDYALQRLGLSSAYRESYAFSLPEGSNPEELAGMVSAIRGESYRPAIFIHGVRPRSGSNYLADLFERHLDISAHPLGLWELPLLAITDKTIQLQGDFLRAFPPNQDVLQPLAFPACLNSGLMAYLQTQVGPSKTMLFKFPFVRYLGVFRVLFPHDYLILLLRDGRDVVASSLKTFGKGWTSRGFRSYCIEWHWGATTILKYGGGESGGMSRTFVLRYEDLYRDPVGHMRALLEKTGLDASRYDYAGLKEAPVRGSSDLANQADGMHWHPWQPPGSFNPIGRWRDWPQSWKRRFKRIAGDTLIAADYEKDNNW